MPKQRSRRDANLRRQIAHLAARLMAEDGGLDYGAAKAKAARQAGLAQAEFLPDNQEVEQALREYQGLYQRDDQPARLRRLREVAVRVMREFAEFRPVLVGAVLNGTAGPHSEVDIHLFTDDPKALTLFLLNRRIRFDETTERSGRGDAGSERQRIHLEVEEVPVTLTVLDPLDERVAPRPRADDLPQRARLEEVEALLRASAAP